MSSILFIVFMAPISLVWHPHVIENGICIAEPGTYAALYCSGIPEPQQPKRKPLR
jgi:hypothetical protein